ncbi:dihydrodipicolinate reductase C-terminal domain-containing protein [Acinetobacter sp. ANC 3882]|uniref:dihydrodipicolinate reductase C-terminal domain-containing protein n=1 Tax=Acinetobacter sp. ANC 3882 TaxID=2923423 RepID=UPI001F4A4040|nr:dihydrodipicolinate reductase C-terminal domain-containing protein [Acinetobacter sp. ANC 3882]MCH7316069.1 dihydrodipicolinate reductase [Acinetobacter sp. ANC 3882]
MTNIYIVGSGKLAVELLKELRLGQKYLISAWADRRYQSESSIVIHAGSGRELQDVIDYCKQTDSILIELSTEASLKLADLSISVIQCPNTNILMLKFMNMIEKSGQNFSQYQISITESHQANKSSIPGTAVAMARALDLPAEQIESVREVDRQLSELSIPEQNLARHAYHRIEISDGNSCSILLETRVLGVAPYAEGVREIIIALGRRRDSLEKRLYSVMELIENKWI